MRLEGKVSKVAICEKCQSFVLACHVDLISKSTEKEFTAFTNEWFTVKLETIKETQERKYSWWENCKNNNCYAQSKA